ncbi:unnamed protein product [Arabis nemorensis]|uniref:Uncharacterized protein n=1 Tax=Arabis nemorensis TaxID=586526 RepID=A0A565BKS3_9BRAS|nr:unnamed protein product [Arabis nemorensis]
MANREGTDPMEGIHNVFVQTSLQTRLAILSHNHVTISDFRDNFCKKHKQSFPEFGEISISALKLVAIMAADQKEFAVDSKGLALEQDTESRETDGVTMGDNQQTSYANQELVDGHAKDEVKDVQANQTLKETGESQKSCRQVPSLKLDDLTGAIEQDLTNGETTTGLAKIDQEKELAPTSELVEGHITSRDDATESHEACAQVQVAVAAEHCDTLPIDDLLSGAIEKDIARGEGRSLAPGAAADNLQTDELVTGQEDQLEAGNDFTTGPDRTFYREDELRR